MLYIYPLVLVILPSAMLAYHIPGAAAVLTMSFVSYLFALATNITLSKIEHRSIFESLLKHDE